MGNEKRCLTAESQIPAAHIWCDFKCRPWAKMSSPNTNNLYIYYMDKSTGTPPSLALPNCSNKDENIIHVIVIVFHQLFSSCNSFEVYEMTVPIGTSHWC